VKRLERAGKRSALALLTAGRGNLVRKSYAALQVVSHFLLATVVQMSLRRLNPVKPMGLTRGRGIKEFIHTG
jgi:hypothetical protein